LTGPGLAAEKPLARLFTDTDTGDPKLMAEAGAAAAQETYAGRIKAGHHHAAAAKWNRMATEAGRAEPRYRLGALMLKGRPEMDTDLPALVAQPLAAELRITARSARNRAAPEFSSEQIRKAKQQAAVTTLSESKGSPAKVRQVCNSMCGSSHWSGALIARVAGTRPHCASIELVPAAGFEPPAKGVIARRARGAYKTVGTNDNLKLNDGSS